MACNYRRNSTIVTGLLAAWLLPNVVTAAQTTITISTTTPPAAPRIQAPLTFAAFPASQLVFSVAATGQAPLSYSATSLPVGLSIAADSGSISGTMPAAGTYPITVTVTNAQGKASATLTLVSGNTLSLTPPAGWNSYDSFGASVTESEVLDQAKALKTQLQPFGWNYVVIDYRWYEPGQPIDAYGRYLPATSKYPSATGSNGFKSLADKVHALGLGFGIHIMRGIPRKSYDANTPILNSTFKAKDAGNTADPCPWDQHMWGVRGDTTAGQDWYNSIIKQYAEWGVDFIKIDDMVNNDTKTYHEAEVNAIAKAIRNSGRSIVLSLSPGPMVTANAANLNANANMWRMVNDFWDYNGLSTLADVFTTAGNWQAVSSLTAGHWPDGDMLPLGYLGPRNEWHASGQTTFSRNEQVTILSLWSILPSPLMYGGNVVSLASDDFTRALLTNEEVMAVNQDSSGTHGKRLLQQGSTEVWTRELSGGKKAVTLFNRGSQDATVSATFSQLGVSGTPVIRDLWHRTDVTGMANALSVTVPYNGALMYTLSPPGSGTGGASSTGGASGIGGAVNTGGKSSGNGGTTARGGAGGAMSNGGTTSQASGGNGQAVGGLGSGGNGTVVAGTGGQTVGGTSSDGTTIIGLGATASQFGGSATSDGLGSSVGGGALQVGGATADSTKGVSSDSDGGGCSCKVQGGPSSLDGFWGAALALIASRLRRRRAYLRGT